MRMLLAVKNPGGRRGGSPLQGLINGDELVVSYSSRFEVHFLAASTEAHGTILAVLGGLGGLTALTHDVVGIHRFPLDGSSHHPSSEVVGGEILNSPQRNLERTMALWTLDFPAGGLHLKKTFER